MGVKLWKIVLFASLAASVGCGAGGGKQAGAPSEPTLAARLIADMGAELEATGIEGDSAKAIQDGASSAVDEADLAASEDLGAVGSAALRGANSAIGGALALKVGEALAGRSEAEDHRLTAARAASGAIVKATVKYARYLRPTDDCPAGGVPAAT